MEFRQLEYFVAVAEDLHFGKAAARLHISEQPLSYQIKKLESDLGFRLFDRTTRSVSLTPAGKALLDDAYDIIARSKRAADSAKRIAAGKAGVIRLGFESATVLSIMPDFVRLFRSLYPDIELVLIEHPKAGLNAIIEDGDDACLVTRFERLPKWVDYKPIMKDKAVVALPIDHALAKNKEIRVSELSDGQFLGYSGVGSLPANQFMTRLSAVSDLELNVIQEAESYMALLGLVAAGLGFTVVTSCMSMFFKDKIAYLPLVDPEVSIDYGLATVLENASPMFKALYSVQSALSRILHD